MASKKARNKKITLSEFKLWLTGVQSMQEQDWHPNKEQWEMILKQIDCIKETEVIKEVEVQATQAPSHYPHHPSHMVQHRRELPPIVPTINGAGLEAPQLIPSPVEEVPLPPMDNSVPQAPGESGIQTPKIDGNAEGGYVSQFS